MRATTHTQSLAWSDEDKCYVVKVPDLPGCMAHGKTRQEAVKMAEEAFELWIETAKEARDLLTEVLMSLPSPEEILRRAVEAKAKGAAALQKQAQMGTVHA